MYVIDSIILGGNHPYFIELATGWVHLTRMRAECEGCPAYDDCKEWHADGDTECLYAWEIKGNKNTPMSETYDFNEPISQHDTEYAELYPNEIDKINEFLKISKQVKSGRK